MKRAFIILFVVAASTGQYALAKPTPATKPASKPRISHPGARDGNAAGSEVDAHPSIRTMRPLSISVGFLSNTPVAGLTADINFLSRLAVGAGYGYFSIGSISASFIPVYLRGYFLESNFSPYVEAGASFVTLKFVSTSSLLNSTFRGTQWVLGGGLEYRFNLGLLLRVSATRYMQANIWSPGVSVGYSFTTP